MSNYDLFSIFIIMVTLAAIPSSSVALVIARSAMLDIKNGIAAAFGIVSGDLIFLSMAILGMTTLSEQMGTFFAVIKYIAALYLIWFGIGLMKSTQKKALPQYGKVKGGLVTSYISGLFLTLADIKAIFFYASLFPIFVDMSILTSGDTALLALITFVSVGSVKIIYATGARKIIAAHKASAYEKKVKIASGGLMIGAGSYLIIKP
ncbi:MAG: threonine transporter [Zetaproteobacteria bacterium]|nr:MAG: threonine transporter [Zetaproteobacteria bacterium]